MRATFPTWGRGTGEHGQSRGVRSRGVLYGPEKRWALVLQRPRQEHSSAGSARGRQHVTSLYLL